MAIRLDETFDKTNGNDIFAGTEPSALVATIKLAAAAEGAPTVLKRGTVVVGDLGGEQAPITEATAGTADTAYVLCEDTDITAATTATAYKSGNFIRQKLITDGSFVMSATQWEGLRDVGIYTEDAL